MTGLSIQYQNEAWITTGIGIANGIIIFVFNEIYRAAAKRAVDWENHKFERTKDSSYVVKVFIFQFVNSYISLFYIGYYGSELLLSSTLVSTIVTKTFVQTLRELLLPYMKFQYYKRQFQEGFQAYRAQRKKRIEEILMETGADILEDFKDIAKLETGGGDENLLLQEQVEETRHMQAHQDLLDEYTNLVCHSMQKHLTLL